MPVIYQKQIRHEADTGGKNLLQLCIGRVRPVFKGENDLSNLISLENGTIYISATETALHCFLFRAMGEFNSIYPNVHFKILNNSTMDSVNAVKEGKVDLAFVSTDLQVNKPLRMKKLREYHEVLIGGSRYIELKGRKISLEELSTYPWISLTSEALTRKFLNNYFADHGLQFCRIWSLRRQT